MRTDPALIELGTVELGMAGPVPVPPPEPATAPPPARARRRWRWWGLTVVTLALVTSASAADPVATRLVPLFQLPAREASAVVLSDQVLYLVTGRGPSITIPDPDWTLSAYRLTDGSQLWSVAHHLTDRLPVAEVQVAGEIPLVTSWATRQASIFRPPVVTKGETTAYDPETGEPLWRHPGFVAGVADGQVVLELIHYDDAGLAMTDYQIATVDAASGGVRWRERLPLEPGPDGARTRVWATSANGRYLATLDRDGWLTVRDLERNTSRMTQVAQPWLSATLQINDGLLHVSMLWERERTILMYDLDPLAQRWVMTGQSYVAMLTACGPVWCLRAPDGLQALDPVTGRPRWQANGRWQVAARLGPPWPGEHVYLARAGLGVPTENLVVDAASGREELALAGWLPMEQGFGDRHASPIVYQRGESLYRPGHPDHQPGRLWLGRVDPELSGVDVLGSLDRVSSCHVGTRHLACVTTDQRIQVWRVRM